MADDVMGVQTDSPPVDTAAPTDQAPSPPASPAAPAQSDNRIPYDRFQQVTRQNADLRRQLEAAQRAAQPQTPPQADAPLTAQEEVEMRQAAAALKRILGVDGDLKSLLDLAKNGKGLLESHQSVQEIAQQQYRGVLKAGDDRVASLAKAAGFPDSPEAMGRIQRQVAGVLSLHPDALQALRRGDLSVVDQAFAIVQGDIDPYRRAQTASIIQTKNAAQQIPTPAKSGGPPGPAAPTPVTATNAKEVQAEMSNRLRSLLMGGDKG